MDMQASRQLAVTQQQAWDALNDPEVLKRCIPGCDKVEATGENQYAVGVAVKIGPVAAKFSGKITLSDIVAPQSYTITFDGQGGAAGFGKGNAQVTLTPNDAGCELAYTVHASVGGKVAQLGQRLIDGAAKSMAEDFFKRFDDEMQRQHPEAYAAQAEAAANAAGGESASAAPAAPATGGGVPVWVWAAGAVVLALAAVFILR
jgi:carbon monoxide dehydrogenase subunit G